MTLGVVSGAGGGAQIAGDLGGTVASPQVTGAHFGGSDGNFFVRRSGLWVPDTIKVTDLPAINVLTNVTSTLTLNADGTLSSVAGAATLGALQTNVAAQFINGNNTRGYIRITAGSTPPSANTALALVSFSGVLASAGYISIDYIHTANAEFGDSIAVPAAPVGTPFAHLTQATNTAPAGFTLLVNSVLVANAVYAFVYTVLT